MNTRFQLIIGAALAALLLISLTIVGITALNPTGTLNLTVVPSDAAITIDGKTKAKAGNLTLTPGNHTLALSRDGFTAKTVTVTITAKQTTSQTVVLAVANQAGQNYFKNNPDEESQLEGITGAEAAKQGQIITQNNPLIQLLPYHGNNYSIDFGTSKKYPDDPDATAVYISYVGDSGKAN
ncbi:MAG TPA: PEGA domain-containing protein, partial [Candidatus Saccharimonas sp.]|nr:PEGA domain-containing protein [Candidatus Saccharimonas sp.]